MKWRAILSILLGILLPLPLVWLLSATMSGHGTHPTLPQGLRLVPMLTAEERQRLRTYDQACRTDAECESPLHCLGDRRTGRKHCTDSECLAESQCPPAHVCRARFTENSQEVVLGCSRVGVRKEGELCEEFPSIPEDGCEKGLLCQGFCGRPCRLDEPSSCPDGFVCKEGSDGPSCLPTCEGRACPAGQRCVTSLMGGIGSVCMTVHGQDCELTPCGKGLDCSIEVYPTAPGEVWMQCLGLCGDTEPRCPQGRVCSLYQCHQACEPDGPSVCEPGFACRRHPSSQTVCRPDSRVP
jgi:hypothetical protein